MLMAKNQTCWLNGEILLKNHILCIAVKACFLFASYQQFHGLLLFICSSFLSMNIVFFTFFSLNKEEVGVLSPIKDGFSDALVYICSPDWSRQALCVCVVLA